MSKLEAKLRELKNKRARKVFLEAVDPTLCKLFSEADFSHDVQCLKYAAFSTWDIEADEQTTTRGKIEGWEQKYFVGIAEAISLIRSTVEPAVITGWFFIDTDGPYYSISLSEFLLNLGLIKSYCEQHEHYDLGWVGSSSDMGIVFEFNDDHSSPNQIEVYTWGVQQD